MTNGAENPGNGYALETSFVLFFLSVDLGQHLFAGTLDTLFLGITVVAVAVLPQFLPATSNSEIFPWLSGRTAILTLGVLSGLAFKQTVGVIVPEVVGYLPLTLATVAGIIFCYSMYANFFGLRYAD